MRFNKKIWYTLIIMGLVLILTSIVFASEVSVMDKIKERGKLIVGTAPGYFPFEMIDDKGKLIGFDIDIANIIAEELGVELELENYKFPTLISALQVGKIDIIIAGMTIIPSRALSATFTDPYFDNSLIMLIHNRHKGVKSWSELDKKGIKIAVPLAQTADLYASKFFKNAEIRRFEGEEKVALAVINGQVDATIHDESSGLIYAKRNPENIFPLLEEHCLQSAGFVIPLNDYAFKFWLDAFLVHFRQSVKYDDLYNYWFIDMPWLEE